MLGRMFAKEVDYISGFYTLLTFLVPSSITQIYLSTPFFVSSNI